MVLDIFFPTLNIQVGVSLAAIAWTICLTKGSFNGDDSRFLVPFIPSASNCHVTLQVLPDSINGSSVSVTMATKYNETFYMTSTVDLVSSSNFLINLNFTTSTDKFSKVSLFTCQRCSSMQIAQSNEDPFYLYETSSFDNDYLLLLDDISGAKTHVYIYGLCKNTTVNVGFDNSGYGAISNIFKTYNLDSYDRIYLDQNYTKDGMRISSSDPINVLFSNYVLDDLENDTLDCNQTLNRIWELVPTTDLMGEEFVIYTPSNSDQVLVKIIGSHNGSVTWYTSTDVRVIQIHPLSTIVLNFTGSTIISLSSTVPIQVLCIMFVYDDSSTKLQNVFFVLPLVRHSNCVYFVADDCKNSLCAIALSNSPIGRIKVSSQYSEWDILGLSLDIINKTYFIWEIHNLTDGIYSLQLYENVEPLIVFKTDRMNMQHYPIMPASNSTCQKLFVPNNSANLSGATITFNASLTATSNISSTEATLSHIAHHSYSNDTSTNNTAVKTLTDRERFPFMYIELPEENRVENEYMIAVIVSLCTAIFAVIAVISICLLKELITKRKQIGTSKIRPFVS